MAYVITSILNNKKICGLKDLVKIEVTLFLLAGYRNFGKRVYGMDGVAKMESHFHDEPN